MIGSKRRTTAVGLLAALALACLAWTPCPNAWALDDLVSSNPGPSVLLIDSDSGDDNFALHCSYSVIPDTTFFMTGGEAGVAIDSDGETCIGAFEAPVGGVGMAKLALHGAQSTTAGAPCFQFTTTEDDYPVLALYSFEHDNMAIDFDCYWDGYNTRSSDSGSNAQIVKQNDTLAFRYRSGRTQGDTVNSYLGMGISLTDGSIKMPAVYSDLLTGDTRDLYIKSDGQLGYVASSIRYKENVRNTQDSDTDWIFRLQPVMYDYKQPLEGVNECGLIAEEVVEVRPEIVSFKRELTYPEPVPGDPDQGAEAIVTITDTPETVNYSMLIVPMLAEIQKLRTDVDAVKADIEALKAGARN